MAVDVLDPSEVEIEWLDLVLHRPLMQGPPAGVMPDAFLAAIEAKHVCKQIADANSEPIRFAGNASDIEWCAGTPVLGGHLLAYANAAPFDARQAAKIARGLAGGLLLPTQILPAITVWDCGVLALSGHRGRRRSRCRARADPEAAELPGVALEPRRRLVTDVTEPHRIEFVQRRHLAARIPPFRGERSTSADRRSMLFDSCQRR